MKKLISLAVSVCMAVLTSCGSGENAYTITGTVSDPELDGKMVYMSDYSDGQIVDSATVNDGKFVFKGIADSAMVRTLNIGILSEYFILEKGNYTVDMEIPFSAKGNLLTEQLNEFISKNSDMLDEMVVNNPLPDSETFPEFLVKLDELSAPYLKEHSNDLLGAMVLMIKIQMMGMVEQSETAFNEAKAGLGEKILNFKPVQQMTEYYESMHKTAAGMMFTDFTIENGNLDGTPASFSDYIGKGKYILVDFWASWCGPCRMEIPNLKAVYNKYKGDNFDILGVAVWDARSATLKAIEDEDVRWNQIIDAQTIPTEIYGIQGIPHIILFAPDGTILARDLRGSQIDEKIAEILSRK